MEFQYWGDSHLLAAGKVRPLCGCPEACWHSLAHGVNTSQFISFSFCSSLTLYFCLACIFCKLFRYINRMKLSNVSGQKIPEPFDFMEV